MSRRTTYADVFLLAALGEEKFDEWKRKEKEMIQAEATGDALSEKSGWQPRNVVEAVAAGIWLADYGTPFDQGDEEQQQQYCLLAMAAIRALDLYRTNCDRSDEPERSDSA